MGAVCGEQLGARWFLLYAYTGGEQGGFRIRPPPAQRCVRPLLSVAPSAAVPHPWLIICCLPPPWPQVGSRTASR